MVNGSLDGPPCQAPKFSRCICLFFRSGFYVWVRPFEVKGKLDVGFILTLRYDVTNKCATVKVSKVCLELY